jgi:hypothetical protein
MVKALGIDIHPLLDDPPPPNGFAPWEPCPPRAAQHLFMEGFLELVHASRSNMPASRTPGFWTRGRPSCDAIMTSSISEFVAHDM